MKQILIALILIISTVPSFADDGSNLKQKIKELNKASISSLGISLNALAYLVEASPSSYLTYEYLSKNEKNTISELEKAGYVRTEIIKGLPDGQEKSSKFLRIIPLDIGEKLRLAMLNQ